MRFALSLIATFIALTLPVQSQAPSVLSPADLTYEGVTTVALNGNNSTYTQGLTHRYVNGQQRFLAASPQAGSIDEFTVDGTRTGRWTIPSGTFGNHIGIWWEEAKSRLWVTVATDYPQGDAVDPSKISLLALPGTGGQAMLLWRGSVAGVNAKRMYGGCRAVPAYARVRVGGEYECGSGGYTSRLLANGGAAIGPTMFAIDEPTTAPSGSAIPLKRRVLDLNSDENRGIRKTIPENYFDGGDSRANPPTRPTAPVLSSGKWLSPNAAGLGWMVWGDSYYNTCQWIDTTTRIGFVCVASLGKGKTWYQSSTLKFDGRQYEVHIFDPSTLGTNLVQRPVSMLELVLPGRGAAHHDGNTTVENIAGATFDATTGKLYLLSCGGDTSPYRYSCGLFAYRVNAGAQVPPPPPPADTDGDGVPDTLDACPSVAAATPDGCPVVTPPPGDSTAPVVSITSPLPGADVSGSVTVSAIASDNVGVQSVQFSVDGVDFGVADTSVAYARVWNAGTTPGTHVLRAVARDAAGNTTTSADVAVTVAGGTPPPPPPADTDGDGVMDSADACPSVAGTLPNGCPPAPTPEPDPMYEQLISLLKSIEASVKAPTLASCTVAVNSSDYVSGELRVTLRCPAGAIARPKAGQILRVGE